MYSVSQDKNSNMVETRTRNAKGVVHVLRFYVSLLSDYFQVTYYYVDSDDDEEFETYRNSVVSTRNTFPAGSGQ
jgi:hypothetical protein